MDRNTLARSGQSRKYQRPDRALEIYMAMGGSRTLAGAHAKELRTRDEGVRLVRSYVAAGSIARALGYIDQLLRETDKTPVQPLHLALKEEGHAGRAQDAAVEAVVIDGATPAELELLIARSQRQAAVIQCLCRSAQAELLKLRGPHA